MRGWKGCDDWIAKSEGFTPPLDRGSAMARGRTLTPPHVVGPSPSNSPLPCLFT